MKAYKGFSRDMKCRDFQYEEGKEYTTDKAEICECGFHACEHPLDTFRYYNPAKSVYHEVELGGELSRSENEDTKVAGTRIKIGARLDIPGLVKAAFDFVRARCTNENNAEPGKPASAGESGAAYAGAYGAASAGDSGAASSAGAGADGAAGFFSSAAGFFSAGFFSSAAGFFGSAAGFLTSGAAASALGSSAGASGVSQLTRTRAGTAPIPRKPLFARSRISTETSSRSMPSSRSAEAMASSSVRPVVSR